MPDSITDFDLRWSNPFRFQEGQDDYDIASLPPHEPGVYIWVIPIDTVRFVSYVGQTSDLWNRWHEHAFSTLGGRYVLYDLDKLRAGTLDARYGASSTTGHLSFVARFQEFARLAIENLCAFEILWATLPQSDSKTRLAVESALISCLSNDREDSGRMLTNDRASLASYNSPKIRCESQWPDGVEIRLNRVIEYGELVAG